MMNDTRTSGQAGPGLCGRCTYVQVITNDRGSRFYLCRRSFVDPRFTKYPRIPVLECEGFVMAESDEATE